MNGERERVSFALHRVEQKTTKQKVATGLDWAKKKKKTRVKKENQECEKLVRPEVGGADNI